MRTGVDNDAMEERKKMAGFFELFYREVSLDV